MTGSSLDAVRIFRRGSRREIPKRYTMPGAGSELGVSTLLFVRGSERARCDGIGRWRNLEVGTKGLFTAREYLQR